MAERPPPPGAPTFARRLTGATADHGPLCVGIDPSAELLAAWGLADSPAGLGEFARRCVGAFAGHVAIVKPQVAFFERHGSAGLAVLEALVADARSAGLLVLCDAKRGDIDSTCEAYAHAWLSSSSPLAGDAVTASPYLGYGALAPMLDMARRSGRAVFVVARSSNPEGRATQRAATAQGPSVEDSILSAVADSNRAALGAVVPGGDETLGPVGVVIGATLGPSGFDVREVCGPILAPGLGAQGAGPEEVAALFAGCAPGTVLPSASRSVLVAGPSTAGLRRAAARLNGALVRALV